MPLESAGLLLYRAHPNTQVFLIHPGGPYWARKDDGAWSMPKGLIDPGEEPLAAARREFHEETGFACDGSAHPLGTFRQPGGKRLTVWAAQGDCDPAALVSGTFSMTWPPHSRQTRAFPEADRGGWFERTEAMRKITRGQKPVLDAFFNWRAGL